MRKVRNETERYWQLCPYLTHITLVVVVAVYSGGGGGMLSTRSSENGSEGSHCGRQALGRGLGRIKDGRE